MVVKRAGVLIGMAVLSLTVAACSSPSSGSDDGRWSAPEPPDEDASGLSIGFIPDGFSFVWNEGHKTATFHVFQTEDGSEQVSIGRQISPEPYPTAGEQIVRDGRELTLVEDTRETRVGRGGC